MSDDDEQLTSADIFGDVLAEVEAEAQRTRRPTAKPEKPLEDIERKLEETLSGVISEVGRGKRPAENPRKAPEAPSDAEIDALLDQTLSSLDIPTRGRKAPKPEPPAPSPPVEAPAPAAVEPAVAEEPPATAAAEEPSATVEPPEAAPPSAPAELPDRDLSSLAAAGTSSDSVLDELMAPADQFRTQPLPALELLREAREAREAAEGEPFGDYTLLERIAVGGMAEVWRARRRGVEGFQKAVAIKKILSHLTGSQDFVTMFIDEAKLAAQLTHNNIIQIYDLGKVGSDFFIAMELVDGKDLRSILTKAQKSRRPVPVRLGLFIVSAVARALDYAHRKRDFDNRALGLVHRDVSPQNVLISHEGEIKLCDFGIVKAVAKASTTQMGALKGKLQYMSPEQAWGKTVDARSDIFSLGSVLFEVLTGTQLFAGDSEIGVLDAVRECRVRSTREIVPEIPEVVDRIVQRALAKTPEERFQTAGDMEHEIRDALGELGPAPSQKELATYLQNLLRAPEADAPAPSAPVVADAVETPPAAAEAPPLGAASAVETAPVAAPVESPAPAAVVESEGETGAALPEADAGAERPKRGLKWLVAAIVVVGLVAVGLLVVFSMRNVEPAPPVAQPVPAVEEAAPAEAGSAPVVVAPPPFADATAAAAEPDADAEQDADGEPGAGGGDEGAGQAEGRTGLPAAAGIDIEQMVNDELTTRAERLRRDFEAEKKRLEEELAKTREETPPPPDSEEADGAGGG